MGEENTVAAWIVITVMGAFVLFVMVPSLIYVLVQDIKSEREYLRAMKKLKQEPRDE